MFGFKGVRGYERGVARQERVAPFRSAPIFTRNAHSLLFASPNVKRVGLAMRPRSVFFAADVVANSFPFPARLFSFSLEPFASRRLPA